MVSTRSISLLLAWQHNDLANRFLTTAAKRWPTSLLPVPGQSSKIVILETFIDRLLRMRKAEPESQISETDEAGGPPPAEGEALLPVEPGTINAEQLEELKARASKAEEHWDRLLRTTADFENFKKRAARERQDAIKYANEALIEKLLTVLDNFEMAQAAVQTGAPDAVQSLQQGVVMIHQQLRNVLTGAGLEEVDASGKAFDPNLHEAVSQQETDAVPEGHVTQQLRKGYKLRERLLRPASVIVAIKPAAQA